MNDKDLETPREIIKQTKLGIFLKEMHSKYASLIKNKKDSLAKVKLKEIIEIWRKTYIEGKDAERIKKREKLISSLPISSLVDENVLIGNKVIEAIAPKIKSAYVITDKNIYSLFKNYFNDEKNVFIIDTLTGNTLKEIISTVRESELPFLVGVGGGRVMDYLKYIMMNTNKFCVAIPTSLTTHVYTSPKIHVLPAIAELGAEKTIDSPLPDVAVLDIDFLGSLQKSDPRLIRAGLGDLLACITAITDWKLAEQYKTTEVNYVAIDMAEVIVESLKKINVERPLSEWIIDYSFIQVLLCRISGWVGSAPVSGSEHLFALAAEHDFAQPPIHGELVALGTIIMTYIQKGDYREVYQLVKKLGLPTSLSKIGLSVKQTADALCGTKEVGLKKGRFTIVNKLKMDRKYCEGVLDTLLEEDVIHK